MKIAIFRWGIFLAVLTSILAAPEIEIISRSRRSVTARFPPIAAVKEYSVIIRRTYVADPIATAEMNFNEKDLNSDGYYYINVNKKLKAGEMYKISVYRGQGVLTMVTDFLTVCPKSEFQCMSEETYDDICITEKQLCDGEKICESGEDEYKDKFGKCIAFQPVPPAVPTTLPTTVVEILLKSQKSVSARFRPLPGVKKYTINVFIKFLADVVADYSVKLNADKDLAPDGYFHVHAIDKLKPGELYEFAVFYGSLETAGSVGFFTDCYDYEFQCLTDSVLGQICLERKQLCDGTADCTGGMDEKKDAEGKCLALSSLHATKVEILTKSRHSVSARFRPLPGITTYKIDVVTKTLAGFSADYSIDLEEKDLATDGYYYVNAINKLKEGKKYEFIVFYGSSKIAGSVDFFTSNIN